MLVGIRTPETCPVLPVGLRDPFLAPHSSPSPYSVHERLASGTLEPDVKDGLAAAKLLAAFDPPLDVAEELEHCIEALQVHMHEVEEIMRPDQLEEFRRRVNGYPVIRQLRAARHSESEANDADSWDA